MAEGRRRRFGKTEMRIAALTGAAAVAAAIYVTFAAQRNVPGEAACRSTSELAPALDPLIGGEVAAFILAKQSEKLSAVSFTGDDGKPKTLDDFSGKITLLNLWATWCAPCRREMPALDRLQAALGGEDFAVVPVSVDIGAPERPAEFLRSVGVQNLPLYTDRSTEIFQSLKRKNLALGLPVTLLLDRNGCHIGHMNGPAEWDSEDGKRLIEAAIKVEKHQPAANSGT